MVQHYAWGNKIKGSRIKGRPPNSQLGVSVSEIPATDRILTRPYPLTSITGVLRLVIPSRI